jgi:anaerobic selenocysteine-containing dehydrogenase
MPEVLVSKLPTAENGIEIKKSICTICDSLNQCGLDLYVKQGKIIKVEGTKENPHNKGTLCAKGLPPASMCTMRTASRRP